VRRERSVGGPARLSCGGHAGRAPGAPAPGRGRRAVRRPGGAAGSGPGPGGAVLGRGAGAAAPAARRGGRPFSCRPAAEIAAEAWAEAVDRFTNGRSDRERERGAVGIQPRRAGRRDTETTWEVRRCWDGLRRRRWWLRFWLPWRPWGAGSARSARRPGM